MNRYRFLQFAAAGLLAALPSLSAEEALPKAEKILDHYVEVTGGAKAYAKHKTEVDTVTMEVVGKGIKGTGSHYAEGANVLESITIEGVGKIEMGTHDGVAWESNAITGARVLDGPEKADRLRDSQFNSPLHWRKIWKSAETTGIENVEGEDCYKVVLTPADGKPETNFFSRKSGLLIKKTRVVVSQMGDLPVEVVAKDYKSFDGVLMPTRIIQKAIGNEMAMIVEDVKFNVAIPAERFEPPDEIKKLLAK